MKAVPAPRYEKPPIETFSKEDVEALGDNIVLILETGKEMTQPEIMQMMQSTFLNSFLTQV